MGGKIILIPESAHVCTGKPPAVAYRKGAQWQCDECGHTWVVVYGAQYNETYVVWRKLNLRNVNGEDLF